MFYDGGHSMAQCKARFGFSNGAWDRARKRGEISTRFRGRWNRVNERRLDVKRLLNKGLSNADVARRLQISSATVCYHARKLGIPADSRFHKRIDWERVQVAHSNGMSVRECARVFGFNKGSWHKAVQRGAIKPRSHLIPIGELLTVGRNTSRHHLKQRLLKEGLKENRCERCGIAQWRGKRLSMQLHHVNGDGMDNRLENIEFLCANCHSLTDTYGGRNGHRKPERHLKLVPPVAESDEEELG